MVDGILEFLPESHVFHLGLFRDEKTLEPVEYYSRFSEHKPVDIAFVLDRCWPPAARRARPWHD